MQVAHKSDFDDARKHWEAFWAGEIIDRPRISIVSPKDSVELSPAPRGLYRPSEDPVEHVQAFERFASGLYYAGDSVPFFYPNFGPDIYAAFLGADMEYAFDQGTSWVKPFVLSLPIGRKISPK